MSILEQNAGNGGRGAVGTAAQTARAPARCGLCGGGGAVRAAARMRALRASAHLQACTHMPVLLPLTCCAACIILLPWRAARSAAAQSAAQQLRSSGVSAQQQAPRVLVSVDDAEAGTAQLQRANSDRKQ